MDQKVLAQYPDIAGLLDYGWFGFISKFLLAVLHGLYRVIPNYGVGIILMTIMVRLCLFPMTRKGQIAMYRMQKLQPLIKEMQEKYKDDRQRQGREMMELYRKHNANPMSGCWPMLFQLPILWGLFRMLQNSIDLRQQPFLFWITDLSKADTIAGAGGIPVGILGIPLHVLPILMTIASLVQQFTMPKPADPQQAQTQKMMMFMPVLIGVMFYPYASGLSLYWLTSTTLGIVEQRMIKLQIKHMEAHGAFAPEEEETERGGRQKFKRK
jgi:YidC/Oxa1 family membrane protein insertase